MDYPQRKVTVAMVRNKVNVSEILLDENQLKKIVAAALSLFSKFF